MTDSFVPCKCLRNPLQWLLSEKVNRPFSEVHCCIPINDLIPPTVQGARTLTDRHPGYCAAGLHRSSSVTQRTWTLHSGARTSGKTGRYRAGSAQCFAQVHHPDQGSGVMSWAAPLKSVRADGPTQARTSLGTSWIHHRMRYTMSMRSTRQNCKEKNTYL